MLVTILTAVYNAQATIAATIESVLNQTYPDIEYIIIDGKSTDNTLKIVEGYQPAFMEKYGNPIRVCSQEDVNMYDALNIGAEKATGEIVGQINADDRYEANAVEIMAKLYEQEKYDAAWGSLIIEFQNGRRIKKHAKIKKMFWTSSGWCHPACFSRREMLLEHPYILNNITADFDYITNLYVEGKKLAVTDETIAVFSFGKGGLSTKKGISEIKKRVNHSYYVYKKHGMSKLYYPYRVIYEIVKGVFCSLKQK